MRKTKRSAFTIVELVIVIAVISVLSAVLIPTFGSIIKNANIASDQTSASVLTTELQVGLKGETIDNEAELLAEISKIDSKKLTPKALNHGIHYWFDMETQMIIAKTAEEVEEMKAERLSAAAPVKEGPALMSAVLTNDATSNDSVNISFRDIYNCRIYLIDGGGTLAEIIETLTNKDTGIEEFSTALGKLNNFEIEDALCVKIEETINSTIIVTNNGTFYPENATNVSFADGVTFIGNTQYAVTTDSDKTNVNTTPSASTNELPLESGNVVIPDTVDCVADNSLNFGDENSVNVEINEDKYDSLCANATDATVNTDYTINGSELVDGEGNAIKELVSVEGRFPGYDFDIIRTNADDNSYAWNNGTLYVAYSAFVNNGDKLELLLTNDGKTVVDDNKGFVNWTCDEGVSIGSIVENSTTIYNILSATKGGHVKGEVTLRDGSKDSVEFDVVVVQPTAAKVTIGDQTVNIGTGSQQTPTFDWGYDGTNGTREISFEVTGYSHQIAHGTSNINVTVDSDAFTYDEKTKALTLNTKGGNGDDAINLAKTGAVDITLSIDGLIETTVKINLLDYTKAEFESNYHYTASADRPYYIGNGQITLGDILKLKADELTYDSYKVSVEVVFNGAYQKVQNIDGWTVAYDFDNTIAKDSWDDTTINISAGTNNTPIRVKITPAAANSDAYTVAINLTYVNGTNVLDADGLLAAANAQTNTNVVIMKDITLADTANSSNYSLNFTTGETLYGNGFVVNATKYVAGTTTLTYSKNVCNTFGCEHYGEAWGTFVCNVGMHSKAKSVTFNNVNGCFINLSGGTIDNIYINGPVYPELQYDKDGARDDGTGYGRTKYHVSGIAVTANSSVINSYISGFRQPVKVDGATLNLTNSTLYGGNYANLQLIKGTINLHDVTTVQPLDGILDTFGEGKNVIGLGIAVEKDAVTNTTSAINISGYLDQYNWVSSDAIREADLPVVTIDGTQIKLDVVLAALFNGIRITFGGEDINRPLNFIENYIQTETDASGNVVREYLNTGIMFMTFAPTKDGVASASKTNAGNLTVTDSGRVAGSLTGTKYTPQAIPLFSTYKPMEQVTDISLIKNLTGDKLVRLLEDFTINSNGWAEGALDESVITSVLSPLDIYIKIWSYGNSNLPEDVDIFADDYYIDYGGYTYP